MLNQDPDSSIDLYASIPTIEAPEVPEIGQLA